MNYRSKHRFVREFKEGDIYFNDFTSLDMTHRNDGLFELKLMNIKKQASCSNDIVMTAAEINHLTLNVLTSENFIYLNKNYCSEKSEKESSNVVKIEILNDKNITIILTDVEQRVHKEFVFLRSSLKEFSYLMACANITAISMTVLPKPGNDNDT